MMKKAVEVILLLFLLVSMPHAKGTRYSPPGKPTLTRCRSPEKETFTCWWEPGSDGGLPTTHALYYRKENSETVYECPDYRTAGENSCFFNKNNTSIWVNYNITVVATNTLGSTFSDPMDIDVVYIVKPNPPERLAVTVEEDKSWPFLRVSWEPPHKADTRSGWITLMYEIRVKLEQENKWEMHLAGQQKMFNIFSLRSGGSYLVQNGKSEEIFSALMVPDFPPTTSSNFEDLLVEYLEVYIPEGQELTLQESKDLHDGCLKSEGSTSDSDSGRGSCDSHTLLIDNCGEAKEEERQQDQERMGMEAQRHQKDWEEKVLNYAHEDIVSPDMSSGRVKTWPSVFSPLPQYSSNPPDQQSSLEMAKQHYLSDSLFLPDSSSTYLTQPGHSTRESLEPSYCEFRLSNKQPHQLHPQMQASQQLHMTHSDVNTSSIGCKQAPAGLQSPDLRSTQYVEVQKVNKEDMVLLQPVGKGCRHIELCPKMPQGDNYSKVKGVNSDNILLLQRGVMEEDRCPCEDQETNGAREHSHTASTVTTTQKPTACIHTAMPVQDEMVLAVNGYVDTAIMCTLPTY
ncbi:Prolactin receptor [Larimichthys crocea]|uniref:Uncharacterized protein n=1 Tax=Larimichthys crocea TaxID=215358 RepID=A0ACD3QPA2_LARCR|nr:Prolactin receptor [Larimichthys crocea]